MRNIAFLFLLILGIFSPLEARPKKPKSRNSPTINVSRQKIVITNDNNYHGMFSMFTIIVGALHFFEQGTFAGVDVSLNGGLYIDHQVGPNWWEYYFEPIRVGSEKEGRCAASEFTLTGLGRLSTHLLSKHISHEIIRKYIHVKPAIQQKVDAYVQNYFADHYVIGIHYRGTDKWVESPRVAYNRMFSAIQEAIQEAPPEYKSRYKIFIATDEQGFIDALRSQFECPILYRDIIRSVDGRAVHHHYYSSNYQKGEDALLDCLLLSRSHSLIRVESNLSFCSELFNPSLKVKLVK